MECPLVFALFPFSVLASATSIPQNAVLATQPPEFELFLDQQVARAGGVPCHGGQCSGHGQCIDDECHCFPHWSGAACTYFSEAAAANSVLSGSDENVAVDVRTVPSDGVPEGSLPPVSVADSAPQVSGVDLLSHCADRQFCNQRGTCEGGLCNCDPGWTGHDCAQQAVCKDFCNSPSGRCEAGACICELGFAGESCGERTCPDQCWHHGTCDSGHCVCNHGWSGESCSDAVPGFMEQKLPQRQRFFSSPPLPELGTQKPHSAPSDPPLVRVLDAPAPARAPVSVPWLLASPAPEPAPRPAAANRPQPESRSPALPSRFPLPALAASGRTPHPASIQTSFGNNRVNSSTLRAAAAAVASLAALHIENSSVTQVDQTPVARNVSAQDPPSQFVPAPAPQIDVSTSLPQSSGDGCSQDCGSHGSCVSGICECSDGWLGDACDTQSCADDCHSRGTCISGACVCSEAFYGDTCEFSRCLNDCSGHGFCNRGTCECDAGFVGPGCGTASVTPVKATFDRHDFVRPNVTLRTLRPTSGCPEDCNGQGHCSSDGVCSCFGGHSGVACQDFCPNGCSGNGECASGRCVCMSGFAGVDCAERTCCSGHGDCSDPDSCLCDVGWVGAQCQFQLSCPDPQCGGHGQCRQNGTCACLAGWSGEMCSEPPRECPACPEGATCNRLTGTCECGGTPAQYGACLGKTHSGSAAVPPAVPSHTRDCIAPHGTWNPALNACECTSPWYGDYCENTHCADYSEEEGRPDCSGHGMCVQGQCFCAPGWGAAPNSVGPNTCAEPMCEVDCGQHGQCSHNMCVCQEGWQGPACREPKCPNDCSDHGTCSFPSPDSPAECTCEYGYALPDCQHPAAFTQLRACPNHCSGQGLCLNGWCICEEGFGGADCAHADTSSERGCPRDCSGHGLCMEDKCTCGETFSGPDCSIPRQCLEACGEVCLSDLESTPCEFCKGQCLTLALSPVIGRHDVRDDLLSTVQRGSEPVGIAPANTTSDSSETSVSLAVSPSSSRTSLRDHGAVGHGRQQSVPRLTPLVHGLGGHGSLHPDVSLVRVVSGFSSWGRSTHAQAEADVSRAAAASTHGKLASRHEQHPSKHEAREHRGSRSNDSGGPRETLRSRTHKHHHSEVDVRHRHQHVELEVVKVK